MRSSTYLHRLVQFMPGDFVYVRRNELAALQVKAKQYILRVLKVKPTGVQTLQGRCGNTIEAHHEAVPPCHMPFLDGAIDLTLARASADLPCEVCNLQTLRPCW